MWKAQAQACPKSPGAASPLSLRSHLSMGTTRQAPGLALQVSTHYDRLLSSPAEAGLG